MRIDSSFNGLTGIVASKPERTPGANAKSIQGERRDNAQLPNGDSTVAGLTTSSLSGEEMRSSRVNALRTAIINGTYASNPQAIADAMFNELF